MLKSTIIGLLLSFFGVASAQEAEPPSYRALTTLFAEWRAFQVPQVANGIPDYSADAMAQKYRELPGWQKRLAAIDTSHWPIGLQVDWYIVWAEMNGYDFTDRVTRPWANDPAFYQWFYMWPTDVPEREGPNIHGAIELPNFHQPLSKTDASEIAARLRGIGRVYQQARKNLTGNGRDLWTYGARAIQGQSDELTAFAKSVAFSHPDLAKAALEAKAESDRFAVWLTGEASKKTGKSGVGKDNYTWNLHNVHLVPYTWNDHVLIMQRELARAHASLRLQEHRNRRLPGHAKIESAEEYDHRLNAAVTEYMQFLENEEIVTIKEYMDAALRARIGRFSPSTGLRGFFSEITYREPIMMRTHDYHWIDLARMREEPQRSPIRRVPLIENIFDSRAEGMATGMEEMMMHAGLLDSKPRARELVWVLLAQRAARALGGLYQHGLEMTIDEATKFASKWTPWGLLPADGETIQGEEHFYLQQPGYESSYISGKIQIERLIAEYARQREGKFILRNFMDEYNGAGIIPVSLIYWEMTGDRSMLEEAVGKR
ncbi:MAG: DUF885 family protein [Bacteroidota bacterium]